MNACFDIGGSFIRCGTPDADGLVPEPGRVKAPGDDYAGLLAALAWVELVGEGA